MKGLKGGSHGIFGIADKDLALIDKDRPFQEGVVFKKQVPELRFAEIFVFEVAFFVQPGPLAEEGLITPAKPFELFELVWGKRLCFDVLHPDMAGEFEFSGDAVTGITAAQIKKSVFHHHPLLCEENILLQRNLNIREIYTFIKMKSMEKLFEITEKLHDIYHKTLLATPEDRLFAIPEPHSNNLFWNIAHALVTEQSLIYKLSKLQPRLDEALIAKYSKGTFPEEGVSPSEVNQVADALPQTLKWIREDYKNGIFKEFIPYTTSAHVTLNSVEDAISFNLFHLGLHYGTIRSIQKLLVVPS